MNNIKCKIDYVAWTDEPNLYFRVNTINGKNYRLNLVFSEYSPPAKIEDFEIKADGIATPNQILQSILDAAWNYGMRPTNYKDVQNETTAIKYHLEDMRKLVFK